METYERLRGPCIVPGLGQTRNSHGGRPARVAREACSLARRVGPNGCGGVKRGYKSIVYLENLTLSRIKSRWDQGWVIKCFSRVYLFVCLCVVFVVDLPRGRARSCTMAMATSMMLGRPVGGDQARVSRVGRNGWGACVVAPGGHCGSALGLSKGNAKRPRRVIVRGEPEGAPKDAPKDVTEPAAEAAKEVTKEAEKGPEAVR